MNRTNNEPLFGANAQKAVSVRPGEVISGVVITPVGEWPHGECVQHVTENAVKAMIDAWEKDGRKEILCDFAC